MTDQQQAILNLQRAAVGARTGTSAYSETPPAAPGVAGADRLVRVQAESVRATEDRLRGPVFPPDPKLLRSPRRPLLFLLHFGQSKLDQTKQHHPIVDAHVACVRVHECRKEQHVAFCWGTPTALAKQGK